MPSRLLLFLLVAIDFAHGSTYQLTFTAGSSGGGMIGYTEGQMYANGNGPPTVVLTDDEDGYIGLRASLTANGTYSFSVFAATNQYYQENVHNKYHFCDVPNSAVLPYAGMTEHPYTISNGARLELPELEPMNLALVTVTSGAPTTVQISGKFLITESTKQIIVFTVCSNSGFQGVQFDSELSFFNTYGYLPGTRVGFVPVFFLLVLITLATLLVYSGLCIRQWMQQRLLVIQGIIAGLQLLSAVEAISWFAFYLELNSSGDPLCCPLNGAAHVVIALTVIKHTLSRALMTLVCIGFGVVRQSISRKELGGLVVLSSTFFVFSFLDEIAEADAIGDDNHQLLWLAGVFVCNTLFVYWIVTALKKTMDELEANRQSEKFKMYHHLNLALLSFLVIWATYAVVLIGLKAAGSLDDGASTSLLGSLAPAIYFGFLFTISVIWRPTERSHMLAMSFELSTDEIAPEIELGSNIEQASQDLEEDGVRRVELSPSKQEYKPDQQPASVVEDLEQPVPGDHSKL